MSVFLKYLASMLAHMAWQRAGGRGPVPPMKLPRGKKPITLPIVSPWQMMVAMWVMQKFWEQYGRRVKAHLMDMNHPVARRVGGLLPDAPGAAKPSQPPNATTPNAPTPNAPTPNATTPSTPAPNATQSTFAPLSNSTPHQVPHAANAPQANAPQANAPRRYDTQKLSNVPIVGSLLSSLRNGHQPAPDTSTH